MASTDIALERVQALLKVDTGSGSLHSHVARVARALATEKPEAALAQLETLSRHIKKSTYRGAGAPDEEQAIVHDAPAEAKRAQWCANALQIARSPSDPLSAPKVLCAVQNFLEDSAMFEWAGVGFGKQESYYIAMSLRKLAAETPALEKLRLWGKIYGIEGDYYVAEGALEVPPGSAPTAPALPGSAEYDVEPRGEGANTYSYWVSQGGSDPWVRLPAARASHIVAARSIKQLFKGSLGSPVLSTPWYPGKERHLLRSQIARISATCTLAMAGFYELDDAEGAPKNKLRETEGFEVPAELNAQAAWSHAAPALLSEGKCSWPELDGLEEGTLPEEVMNQINAKKEAEPEKAMLESIEPDLEELKEEGAEGSVAWSIKVYGDKGLYTYPDATKSYRVTAVRSLIWPGAVTVAQGNRFANLYVGNGLKCGTLVPPNKESGLPLAGTSPFSSGNALLTLAPMDVMEEPADQEEQEEPQPAVEEEVSDKEDNDDEA